MSMGVPSALLASVVCLTVAIAILFRKPRRALYVRFAAFTLNLTLWYVGGIVTHINTGFYHLQTAAALALPASGLVFFRGLLRSRNLGGRQVVRFASIAAVVLFVLSLSPLAETMSFRALFVAHVYMGFTSIVIGLWRQLNLATSDGEKQHWLFLLFGSLVAVALTTTEFFPNIDFLAGLGHIVATFYVYFLYQSISARRLIDLLELSGKATLVAVLTCVLAIVYAVLGLWMQPNQKGVWIFNTLVASFVILIVYDQVRSWVENATAKLLFRERYELRQAVHRLVLTLRTTLSLEEMRDKVLETLHNTTRTTRVSIYLANESDLSFQLFGCRGSQPLEILSFGEHASLLQDLRRDRRPILLEQLQERLQEKSPTLAAADPIVQREVERTREAIQIMRSLEASAICPMITGERVVGILAVGTAHPSGSYSADEIALLLSLAEACAIVMDNSFEYARRRERDRLAAVGEMAAGMAHEIRNPLGAIKGAAQCLDPASLPPEAHEFVDVIVQEVDRLNGVVGQFLEYARPYRGQPVPIHVNDVVESTLRLVGKDVIPSDIRIERRLSNDLPMVSIDPEHLRQVLINLVLNAIQAMPHGGELLITTVSTEDHSGSLASSNAPTKTNVVIRIRDTGTGIRPEDLPRIFVPFFTTKERGTGLGLAISQRLIENAGGRLEVFSTLGKGTTFTIRMPPPVETRVKSDPRIVPARAS